MEIGVILPQQVPPFDPPSRTPGPPDRGPPAGPGRGPPASAGRDPPTRGSRPGPGRGGPRAGRGVGAPPARGRSRGPRGGLGPGPGRGSARGSGWGSGWGPDGLPGPPFRTKRLLFLRKRAQMGGSGRAWSGGWKWGSPGPWDRAPSGPRTGAEKTRKNAHFFGYLITLPVGTDFAPRKFGTDFRVGQKSGPWESPGRPRPPPDRGPTPAHGPHPPVRAQGCSGMLTRAVADRRDRPPDGEAC